MDFQALDRNLSDDELFELSQFLASPGLVDTAMDLYGVDGFFASLFVGPRTLAPSQWIRWIWDSERGEAEPEFESLADAQRILGLLMRHYNTVGRLLMAQPSAFEPIYQAGDVEAATSWCSGFLTGARLDRDAWMALMVSKPRWFAPIVGLGVDDDDQTTTPTAEQLERWTREVGPAVAKIRAFWTKKRQAQPPGLTADHFHAGSQSRPARAAAKTGRNDPCPCGSGRKFKRCCGASLA